MMAQTESRRRPTSYEENAIREIHAWKNPVVTWFDSALRVINRPLDVAADAAFNSPESTG